MSVKKSSEISTFLRSVSHKKKQSTNNIYKAASRIIGATRHGGSLPDHSRLSKIRRELKGFNVTTVMVQKSGYPEFHLRDNESDKELVL